MKKGVISTRAWRVLTPQATRFRGLIQAGGNGRRWGTCNCAMRTECALGNPARIGALPAYAGVDGRPGSSELPVSQYFVSDSDSFQRKVWVDFVQGLAEWLEALRQAPGGDDNWILRGPFLLYSPHQSVDRIGRTVENARPDALIGSRPYHVLWRNQLGSRELRGPAKESVG